MYRVDRLFDVGHGVNTGIYVWYPIAWVKRRRDAVRLQQYFEYHHGWASRVGYPC